jgi:hypothetical protein
MDMTLSVGYAVGLYGGSAADSDEFMVSLKVL